MLSQMFPLPAHLYWNIQFNYSIFSSVQDGIYTLGKVHMRSQVFPQCCLWNSSNVCLSDDGPLSSCQGRPSSASFFHASLLQAIDMALALCPHVVSQASQHFRSSGKQATREGCFARHSVSSVVSLHSGMSRAVFTGVFEGGCRPSTYFSLGFPFHFSLFVASLLNLWEWWHVWSDWHLLRQSIGGHGWLIAYIFYRQYSDNQLNNYFTEFIVKL